MYPIYFDCEFTELSRHGQLISIGLIDEYDHEFYAEFEDYDKSNLNDFIKNTVIPKLKYKPGSCIFDYNDSQHDGVFDISMIGTSDKIRKELNDWLKSIMLFNYKTNGSEDPIAFFSDCYAFDWMLFTELMWGNGFDIPKEFSYIPIDLSTALWCAGYDPDYNREQFAQFTDSSQLKHNSAWDAIVIRKCFQRLKEEKGDKISIVGI